MSAHAERFLERVLSADAGHADELLSQLLERGQDHALVVCDAWSSVRLRAGFATLMTVLGGLDVALPPASDGDAVAGVVLTDVALAAAQSAGFLAAVVPPPFDGPRERHVIVLTQRESYLGSVELSLTSIAGHATSPGGAA